MSQARVVIENVQPVVDAGMYPAKRTVGERVDVTAQIFSDGHDHVRARIAYQNSTDVAWRYAELVEAGNDEWGGRFEITETGTYQFYVEAWVDHFDTWWDGIKKKVAAKVDVAVEVLEGGEFLSGLAAVHKDATLKKMAELFSTPGKSVEAVQAIWTPEFAKLVHDFPLIQFSTRSATYQIKSEFKKARFSGWYELFPRSSALEPGRHGNFRDVIKLLPRISAMGFDVLYLPPIHPIGKINRKGKNNNVRAQAGEPGSPWAIGSEEGGHKSIHAELGTLADYIALIAEAKKMGIDLAMDVAFQCAPDHPYVKEHPDWFRQRPDGTIQYAENPPKKYQDIYPFNFETDDWKNLWDELKSVFIYWAEQGVRIFRVDNPHTKPFVFWKWVIAEVQKNYPDTIFLSEAFTRPKIMANLAKAGFTQSYTYFTWRVTKQELVEYLTELTQGPSRQYFRPNFWPNTPDILPYHLQHQGENIFIVRYALAATLSSNYGMYGPVYEFFENVPVEGKEEYYNSEKYEIKHYNWRKTNRMTDIISIMNRIRHQHPAFQSTWNLTFCPIENNNIIAFLKATDDLSDLVLVVVNLDPQNVQTGYVQLPHWKLPIRPDKANVKLHDLFTDEHFTWAQEWNYIELNPHKLPFHVFHLTIHESNM
jgi:starch synthase (maltosyl-transferring)